VTLWRRDAVTPQARAPLLGVAWAFARLLAPAARVVRSALLQRLPAGWDPPGP